MDAPFSCLWRGRDSNPRPPGYGPDELPLLYPATCDLLISWIHFFPGQIILVMAVLDGCAPGIAPEDDTDEQGDDNSDGSHNYRSL